MINKRSEAIILERIGVEWDQATGGVLDLDVLVDKIDRGFTALDYFLDLLLLADLGHGYS